MDTGVVSKTLSNSEVTSTRYPSEGGDLKAVSVFYSAFNTNSPKHHRMWRRFYSQSQKLRNGCFVICAPSPSSSHTCIESRCKWEFSEFSRIPLN